MRFLHEDAPLDQERSKAGAAGRQSGGMRATIRIGAFIEGGFGRNAYAFCMKRRGREELGVSVQRALHFFVGDR